MSRNAPPSIPTVSKLAEQLEEIQQQDAVKELGKELSKYGDIEQKDYTEILETLEQSIATIETYPITKIDIFKKTASELSSLSHHKEISGIIGPELRHIATEIELLIAYPNEFDDEKIMTIKQNIEKIYTIYKVLSLATNI